MPFGIGVWSTGLSPLPLVKQLQQSGLDVKDKSGGRVVVDDRLHPRLVTGSAEVLDNVYCIGDCAAQAANSLPATAQVAEQEGKYVARALNFKAQSKPIAPFEFHNMGMLAYVGGKRALVDLPWFKNSGFGSWLFWNAAYLTKLVSIRNKIMIPMYWFKSFVFGRDISRF